MEQVFADVDRRAARAPAIGLVCRERRVADLRRHRLNLLRAAGALASLAYAKARGATLRRDLINVAARTARSGRGHITLHLPEGWHREHEWMTLLQPPADRPPRRPDQPGPGHRTPTALSGHPNPDPEPGTPDKPQNR